MTGNTKLYLLISLLSFSLNACKKQQDLDKFHFTLVKGNDTNIDFNNRISENDSINVFNNEYMFNGSGVGIGDFNNDGLEDLFFAGSMVTSKLYLNKGNFKFEDITFKSGVQTNEWCTGVSIIDINNDGFNDIYVCTSHSHDKEKRRNRLFINDGHLHFSEQAAAYGLADTGYSTQSAFLDYDKDGDLDMYLLNHRLYYNGANNLNLKDTSGNSPAEDKLYRNEGFKEGKSHPVFRDVSNLAGIKEDGYGLGIVITDANNDNWPDIYVANDYLGNDLLWLNNRNGTFSNTIETSIKHQSFNSMGVDAADISNDGLPDVGVLDMLPENNERKKMMFSGSSQERYDMERRLGYQPEFVRNILQLNNGTRNINNRKEPFYSEIGQLAGISETDWSWSILMADFDNDGWKDIHITNGLEKDVTNNDYVQFKNSQKQHEYDFGEKNLSKSNDPKDNQLQRKNLDNYGNIKINNYFFRNNSNLTFSDATEKTGLALPSVSNGAAYADLDNDGDLDLVVNNMNQEAFVWRNELRKSVKDTSANFITIQLKGPAKNVNGFGSKVSLYIKGSTQFLEQSPVRGFSSSVDSRLHFGVGDILIIDSLTIQWPDDKVQVLKNVKVNQLLTLKYEDAKSFVLPNNGAFKNSLFTDITQQSNIDFTHTESKYFDFGNQRVLLQKYSQLGPPIATGDINGDGLEDFFVGGAANQPGKLFLQKMGGIFTSKDLSVGKKMTEDLGAVFFDADGDNDLDLLVTCGSSEFGATSPLNCTLLYTNTGRGNFVLNATALPASLNTIATTVDTADFDNDGDLDLFIGGRVVPGKYPSSPQSFILQNNKGVFSDVTAGVCPALKWPGLITAAKWIDFNNDGKTDLVIAGDWMPVRFFANNNGKLNEVTNQTGLTNMDGLWRSLQAADVDGDGDIDVIAGNMGTNNRYHMTADKPMFLYAKDMDMNGFIDLVPAYYIKNDKGKSDLYPGIDRTQLAEEVPAVKKKYLLHNDYSKVTMDKLVKDYGKDGWVKLTCQTMQSVWIENLGNGKFKQHPLPLQAQFAPVNAIVTGDVDNDGNIDLILAGNEYQTDVSVGRYDASYGLVLKGNGRGGFVPYDVQKSGFITNGDVKALQTINLKGKGNAVLVAVNDGRLQCFAISKNKLK